jgi:hypothetical protein
VRLAVILALVAFAVYMGSFRTITGIDGNTNALLAYSLVRERDVDLDEFVPDQDRISFWSFELNGHRVSPYPPGAALVAVPFAALGTLIGIVPPQTAAVSFIAKSAAAAATALSVAFVFLLAARVSGRRLGLVVAGLYAFGTATWPISGGALWQHGPAQLFYSASLLWLYPATGDRWSARSGVTLGLATLCRLTDGAFALASAGYVLATRRRIFVRFLMWAAVPTVALLMYNVAAYGEPFDLGYAVFNFTKRGGQTNILAGFAGNLVAPNRGIFVYSPFLLLAAYELIRRALGRDRLAVFLRPQLAAATAVLLVYAASVDWWSGDGYGNRYLADALPLLALGLALWLRRHRRSYRARLTLAATGAFSVVVAAIGALFHDWTSWSWERARDIAPADLQWTIDPPQIVYTAMHAPSRVDSVAILSLALITAAGVVLVRLWAVSSRARAG